MSELERLDRLAAGYLVRAHEVLGSRGSVCAFRTDASGRTSRCFNCGTPALIHDALGFFDATSTSFEPMASVTLENHAQAMIRSSCASVRRTIRRFLASEQSAEGGWRFFGRTSGIPCDAFTTASASIALLDGPSRPRCAEAALQSLERHRNADGFYTTFAAPWSRSLSGAGAPQPTRFDWVTDDGRKEAGYERVVHLQVIRWLAACGADTDLLAQRALEDLRRPDQNLGSTNFPEPLVWCYFSSFLVRGVGLPAFEASAAEIAARTLGSWRSSTQPASAFRTALAVHALVNLGRQGSELAALREPLARCLSENTESGEFFFAQGYGSTALVRLLAATAYLRAFGLLETEAAAC